MLYHAGEMLLESVGEFLHGKVNDGFICRDRRSAIGACYILLLVHDRSGTKSLLRLIQESQKATGDEIYPFCFTQNEQMGLVFPYREERELFSFAPGQMVDAVVREKICINIVMECMSSSLPYPMICLQLVQNCIHLEKDNTVYLLPKLDLTKLDPAADEADCATMCAKIVLELLEDGRIGKRNKKLRSYELIHKKLARRKYTGFPELYQDIRVTSVPEHKRGFISSLKGFWSLHKDKIFKIFLIICIIVVALSLIFAICQMIFGDIPFLRFFEPAFEVIGTETLT